MDRGAWQGTCSPWGRKMLATTERLNHHHRYFWSRKWQLTPVLLPGKSHGWRSLAGCSPWGHKDSDVTEQLSGSTSIYTEVPPVNTRWCLLQRGKFGEEC